MLCKKRDSKDEGEWTYKNTGYKSATCHSCRQCGGCSHCVYVDKIRDLEIMESVRDGRAKKAEG